MKRYQKFNITTSQAVRRKGVITPLAAIVMLIAMASIALIVNRLWLDAASLEVTTCIETAALAAGQELASDELLKEEPDYQILMDRAEKKANGALVLNTIAGQRMGIELTKDNNLFFGKSVPVADTGSNKFLQTKNQPTSVQIKTHHSNQLNNPVAEFMSDITATDLGSTNAQIEASVDNRVIGLRPFDNISVPAFPLAILKNDPTGKHTETWEIQIDQKKGKDEYQFHPDTHTVTRGSDGIPEIRLTGKPRRGDITDANMQILDFDSRLDSEAVVRQILSGLSEEDLKDYHGELLFDSEPIQIKCSPNIENDEQDAFQKMIGQCRICFLYDQVEPTTRSFNGIADCTDMIAGRVMSVNRLDNQTCEIILQPGVLTSRAAILEESTVSESETNSVQKATTAKDDKKPRKNKYIYKLFLTQ